MKIRMVLIALALGTATPALAFDTITERGEFLSTIEGKQLRLGLFGIRLDVQSSGQIIGEARGYPVTGTWSWQDGFFCRQMDWGGTEIPYNCQLVEVRGGQIRFTTDRGAGDDATFNLR